ncbi:glycosyltransferase family 2 protein [Paracoccus aerodenitrificans]|uniref:glycosyltransferase family 2 protein n=1 Tax=Paracoccus aerodenitrificans TaxID=3017781 RepID=UPI0022F0D2A5|nr:glycosyltransferase family A protein [Paracoccus aerodenitrificans]WBU63969.1 glycosyltransferase family A protein [Paracoccus aerodenitrificans]
MTFPRSSVIVISRGRPEHLHLCLTSLALQDHPDFEIILVSDEAGHQQRPDLPVKRLICDQPNVSEARNMGIAEAAGDIIAFIDDDAVAEPGWLSHLTQPFLDDRVIASTGWTRDRDGFSWQVRGHCITRTGLIREIPNTDQTVLLKPQPDEAVSTVGTNCAFRATSLREIGGFDPAFSFHLDESDVNMRMATAFPAGLTAIVPQAQVIHARADGEARRKSQAPLDLSVQGRSAAIFTRRHAGLAPGPELIASKRRKLIRRMLDGQVEPLRIEPLLDSLRCGMTSGEKEPLPPTPDPRHDHPSDFLQAATPKRDWQFLAGWHWHAADLRHRAEVAVRAGKIVTLLLLTPSFLPHYLRLTEGGWFEQIGGVWGASRSEDPPARIWRKDVRLKREREIAKQRRNRYVRTDVRASYSSGQTSRL